MDWGAWAQYLAELIGQGSLKVLLLVPRRGEKDLSEHDATQLSDVVHKRLFGTWRTAADEIRRLGKEDSEQILPLLYLCSWLARQQETNLSFWPQFCEAVVRGKLAQQTVQQTLASLITDLWWKLHREWGLYRPQEGRVNVKWPQAHAGLTDGELDYVSMQVVRAFGWSETAPEILYDEPDEFLGLLSGWVQSGTGATQRLRSLVLGPTGPALLTAEVAARWLLEAWPPPQLGDSNRGSGLRTRSPHIAVSQEPLSLRLVLPEGQLSGTHMVEAVCGDETVHLEVSFSASRGSTTYAAHTWEVARIPWPSEVALKLTDTLRLRVRPDCPFGGRIGAMMFEPGTGSAVKRWKPNRQFLLLLPHGSRPQWLDELFVAVEPIDSGRIGALDLELVSAIGRDLADNLDRNAAAELIRLSEQRIQDDRALISLPDAADLFSPEIVLWGGAPLEDAHQVAYQQGEPPAIAVRNLNLGDVEISLRRRDDDGSEEEVASAVLSSRDCGSTALLEVNNELEPGPYVVRGAREPQYFSLATSNERRATESMSVDIGVEAHGYQGARNDLRWFAESGIRVSAWPDARVTLRADSEAGVYVCSVRLNSTGTAVVRADDIQLAPNSRWLRLGASAWLARSPILELWLRPYVSDWGIDSDQFLASVKGADSGTICEVVLIPQRPWMTPIWNAQTNVEPDGAIRVRLESPPDDGWVLVSSDDSVWLLGRLRDAPQSVEYSRRDLTAVLGNCVPLPAILRGYAEDNALSELYSLTEIARVALAAKVSNLADPIPGYLAPPADDRRLADGLLVRLPHAWGGGTARLTRREDDSKAFLEFDHGSFSVQVVSIAGEGIRVCWDENSGPCICATCDKVMTQKAWHLHGCKPETRGLRGLSPTFTALGQPDWRTTIRSLRDRLLLAISDDIGPPAAIETLWTAFQTSHRETAQNHGLAPDDWVGGTLDAWMRLFELVNSETDIAVGSWIEIWEEVSVFEAGLCAFGEACL